MEKEQQERKYGCADRGEGAVKWTGAKPRNLGPENDDEECADQKEENKDQEEGQYEDEEEDEEEEEDG
jgi:hypothetical protein